jgi:hypothetical protein
MTLQIGIVAADGLVVASDRLQGAFEGSGYTTILTSKFLQGEDVLCCWSGDSVAERAANIVRSLNLSGRTKKEQIRSALIEAGNRAWLDIGAPAGWHEWQPTRKLIVAIWKSATPLWVMHVSPTTIANPVLDKVVIGDDKNTARHFANNYIPYPPPSRADLVLLASHVILTGALENPSGVRGLEIVTIPSGGEPLFGSSDQELELVRRSEAIRESIATMLSGPVNVNAPTPSEAAGGSLGTRASREMDI